MFREFCVAFIVVFLVTLEVQSRPAVKSGLKGCFQQKCPENTFACKRVSIISDDKKEILSEIQCLGLKDKVLKNISKSEPNYFGPGVFFQGFSYTSAYEFTDDSGTDNNNNDKDVDTNIVDVDKDVSDDTSSKSSTFSEVDDLNKPDAV